MNPLQDVFTASHSRRGVQELRGVSGCMSTLTWREIKIERVTRNILLSTRFFAFPITNVANHERLLQQVIEINCSTSRHTGVASFYSRVTIERSIFAIAKSHCSFQRG